MEHIINFYHKIDDFLAMVEENGKKMDEGKKKNGKEATE